MTVEDLLARARADQATTSLPADAQRGAEAYFQSYQYVADGNPTEEPAELRNMAAMYLDMTASPPLTGSQAKAADTAQATLARLS